MNGYIPKRMLEKQYIWEFVNLYLYDRLFQLNPYQNLNEKLADLYHKQASQVEVLHSLALSQRDLHDLSELNLQFQPFKETVDELYFREHQLLQEYLSYPAYFLPGSSTHEGISSLIQTQSEQVDFLLQLKDTAQKDSGAKTGYILQEGYKLKKVISGLTFAVAVEFDDQGSLYAAESGYAYGVPPREGRVIKVTKDGAVSTFAGGFKGPVTGLCWDKGILYVAEGAIAGYPGESCGRIYSISADGRKKVIVDGLATCGDHFTGDIIMGPDQKLYFTVGTATNSAVVGTDNTRWLKMHPEFHDIPSRNYVLNGRNFITSNPLTQKDDAAVTGAFKPFGEPSSEGEVLQGELMSNGVLYSCQPDGTGLQIIADGFRNPFGLKFSPFNGKLYLSDNGADARGSRQIYGDWDNLWEVTSAGWHGWPDFFSGLPATLDYFNVKDKPEPSFLLKQHPPLASQPVARFKPHTASHKFDFSTNPDFGYEGEIFIAQFGGMGAGQFGELPGFKVVRVDPRTGQIRRFFENPDGQDAKEGPIRPVEAKFSRDGNSLYIVDFGVMGKKGRERKTGAVWQVVRE